MGVRVCLAHGVCKQLRTSMAASVMTKVAPGEMVGRTACDCSSVTAVPQRQQ